MFNSALLPAAASPKSQGSSLAVTCTAQQQVQPHTRAVQLSSFSPLQLRSKPLHKQQRATQLHTVTASLATCLRICRYGISDDDAAAEAEGQAVRQSEGADLVQLLAESEQFYAQAHFRYRSFLDTADTEPPPVDVAALEQVRRCQ
jgi:hypothetical protein